MSERVYLGLDTSNYTTSAAFYNPADGTVRQSKMLLPVKEGERGLRQSDAVFLHTKQLPDVMDGLSIKDETITAVGVSTRPCGVEGSYMPCFLVGKAVAHAVSLSMGIPLYETSHQMGHILAALYSCKKLDFLSGEKPFIAFHVSGGTTDCLIAKPNLDSVLDIDGICSSSDLKAGQLIDRVGVMLGLKFPCGAELEQLATESDADYSVKIAMKDGSPCLSGIENKCRDMMNKGVSKRDIALYALKSIETALYNMSEYVVNSVGNLPIVYSGGVMADKLIRNRLKSAFDAYFCEPEFSRDNAAGIALFAAIKDGCNFNV